jgi:hypothetical protein
MNSFNNTKIKKVQISQETANIYYPNKPKNRILNESINRKHDYDTLKNLTRKSIEINIAHQTKNNGLTILYQPNQSTKPYRRVSNHNFRKNTGPLRYEEEDNKDNNIRPGSKSPYVRMSNTKPTDKEVQGRITVLNKSSHKIKSNQLLKQNSPRYFYRQPRSSLSQHYDPSIETSLHKRKISVIGDDKAYMLE